jgi:broad specificity phosphatase PhoE
MVYLIRHGQSRGQIADRKARKSDPALIDYGLTPLGWGQARNISQLLSAEEMDSIQLVISSPLTRALHTSVLGFPSKDILVHYHLREVGGKIPENRPRSMKSVTQDLECDIRKRGDAFSIDYESLRPEGWPNPAPQSQAIGEAFRWLYHSREESTFAVVCHYNVIRCAILNDEQLSVGPENAVPMKCRLLKTGVLVPV